MAETMTPAHPTIALAIPHTPWIPARVESMTRLQASLKSGEGPRHWSIFADRESNRVWSQKLFRWALETGATHLLQLQDDVIVAPRFWSVLRAMIEAQPTRIIGLEASHPLSVVQHQAGRRWYRDTWLIGVGYVFPRLELHNYVLWCEAHPDLVASTNEDSLISRWAFETKRHIWHPIPTIIDHDIGVPSTYGNDGHHEFSMYRRPLVTWREVNTPGLEDPAYWRVAEEGAPVLPGPGTQLCWYCLEGQGSFISPKSGARLCKKCIAEMLGTILSRFR